MPGLFFFLGIRPEGTKPEDAASLHSPRMFVDERALIYGVRAMASVAVGYMVQKQ